MDKTLVEKIIDTIDQARKLLTGVLVVALSILVLVFVFRSNRKHQILIQPFQLSGSLTQKGYTGEVMTALFIRRIREMQDSGRSFYLKRIDVIPDLNEIPTGGGDADQINAALSESVFGEVKTLLEYFAGANTRKATGQMALIDTTLIFVFTVDGESLKASGGNDVSVVLNTVATQALHQIDPYALASYYLQTGENAKCLQIAQELLNDGNPDHSGLAYHLRGLAYLQLGDTAVAKLMFLAALPKIKSPWMTMNNLGVIYDHYHQLDSASQMYRKSIALKPYAFSAYLNYANELHFIRYPGEKSKRILDSSILLYRKAIRCNQQEPLLYVALFAALYDDGDTAQASYYRRKVEEMAPDNFAPYFQIGAVLKGMHRLPEAQEYFDAAVQHSHGDSTLIKQIDAFSKRP